MAQFEGALVPAENRIAGKLKSQLRNMNANALQFLQEFKRYQELIRRPSIQRELVREREKEQKEDLIMLEKLSVFFINQKSISINWGKWGSIKFCLGKALDFSLSRL